MRVALSLPTLGIIIGIAFPAGAVKIYKWTDKDGVVHVVDDPEHVPTEYGRSADIYDTESGILEAEANNLLAKVKSDSTALYLLAGILVLIFFLKKLHSSIRTTRKISDRARYIHAYELSGIERMDSPELRRFVMGLLKHRGFTIIIPAESLNPAVDFIAEKEDSKYAVQIYNQDHNISRVTVNDLDREKARFECNRSMIISRGYYDDDARDLASRAACTLADKDTLAKWIYDFHAKS